MDAESEAKGGTEAPAESAQNDYERMVGRGAEA